MNIAVINTGGTIGSAVSDGVISPANAGESRLLTSFPSINIANETVPLEYKTYEPFRILSENMDFEHLTLLIEEINTVLDTNPEGIIVTHGTDSLIFTAAFLYYVFKDIDIPIVLVSSNFVLSDPRTNGTDNFKYALKFIAGHYGNGVYVSYKNTGGYPTIHRGDTIHRGLELTDDVFSIKDMWYGRFEDDTYVSGNITSPSKLVYTHTNRQPDLVNSKGVILISVHTGMVYPTLTKDIGAVVISGYHAGTIPVNDKMQAFANEAKTLNIPIYTSGLDSSLTEYETVDEFRKMGIIPIPDTPMTALYAQAKLRLS